VEITDEIRLEDHRIARPNDFAERIPSCGAEAIGKNQTEGTSYRRVRGIIWPESRAPKGILRV
jgi:hypothetical protein